MVNWFFQQHYFGEYAFSWWGLALVLGIVFIITLICYYFINKDSGEIQRGEY